MSGRPGRLLSVIKVITLREKKMPRPLVAHGRSEEPDHTGRMPGLLWVFARAHPRFVVPIMPKLNYGWQARARVKV